jgi:hypothetical protein
VLLLRANAGDPASWCAIGVRDSVMSMDRAAIRRTVHDWIAELTTADPSLAWLSDAELAVEPAFLVDAKTKEGDDYKAGAVRIAISPNSAPDAASIQRLYDAVVADRTLGGRAKRAHFERPRKDAEAGTLVVIPR